MSDASSSSSSTKTWLENPNSIQVQLPSWVTDAARLPISALTVERYGDEWFLYLHLQGAYGLKTCLVLPARDILINGKSLDRFLVAIGTRAI